MAYAESHYLDVNADQELKDPGMDAVANHALYESIVPVLNVTNEQAVSDYCGFVSEEIPPIYREQLRQIQKDIVSKMSTVKPVSHEPVQQQQQHSMLDNDKYFAPPKKEEKVKAKKEKSAYLWDNEGTAAPTNSQHTNIYTKDYATMDVVTLHDYVPGFSPPQANDEIHKLGHHALPRGLGTRSIVPTENVFLKNGNSWIKNTDQKASAYLPMEGEDFETAQTKIGGGGGGGQSEMASQTGSIQHSMAANSEASLTTSTASLGPPLQKSFMSNNNRVLEEKYKGLSAFKPVSASIESRYAFADLN